MNTRIFVYGTLKRSESRGHVLREQLFLGESKTAPRYRLHDCGPYPAMVLAAENGVAIQGEVYEVDADCLARLDIIEDAPWLYRRLPIKLAGGDEAQAYLYQRDVTGLPDCGSVWSGKPRPAAPAADEEPPQP